MRRAILLALAATLTGMATAGPPYSYAMSGDQFVRMMTRPEPLSSYDYMEREKAYSYLDGAKDGTAGVAWCPPRPRKTFELAYDAADYIKTLAPEVRKGSAAALLLIYLGSQYPCKGVKP